MARTKKKNKKASSPPATQQIIGGMEQMRITRSMARQQLEEGEIEEGQTNQEVVFQGRTPAAVVAPTQPAAAAARRWKTAKTPNPMLPLIPRPEPSDEYKVRAFQPIYQRPKRPLLVILDLNGTLLHRTAKGGTQFITRPGLNEFLTYLRENHYVMFWSSSSKHNVTNMVKKLLGKSEWESNLNRRLVGIWGRNTLRLGQYASEKVQVYKQLTWVWDDVGVRVGWHYNKEEWDQSNTVLIDDSTEKAASEPYNHIELDEFEARPHQRNDDALGQVTRYLEQLSSIHDVSTYIRVHPFKSDARAPPTDWGQFVEPAQAFQDSLERAWETQKW
jgi:hypothetical protein